MNKGGLDNRSIQRYEFFQIIPTCKLEQSDESGHGDAPKTKEFSYKLEENCGLPG